eukprot:jgi/Chlat1/8325/Chrsp8S00672
MSGAVEVLTAQHTPLPSPVGPPAAENCFGTAFRDYTGASGEVRDGVAENYRLNHTMQTVEFVRSMHAKHCALNERVMSIWEAAEMLNDVVDDSDPDLDMPQIEHLLQTAEAIREAYPDEDWFHLVGFIHDLGKVLAHPAFGSEPQYAVVGDTFPVGCRHDACIVYHKYFEQNPDSHMPAYNTECGIYYPGCGLDNVLMSWGHDEYMHQVMVRNGCTLPTAAGFVVRYHSFYPLHTYGAYDHLLNDEDRENVLWLKRFQKFDLYSKRKERMDVQALKPYYQGLIEKYFPAQLRW